MISNYYSFIIDLGVFMALNYSIYSKLFLSDSTNIFSIPISENKILFFGIILGYEDSNTYKLESSSKDLRFGNNCV